MIVEKPWLSWHVKMPGGSGIVRPKVAGPVAAGDVVANGKPVLRVDRKPTRGLDLPRDNYHSLKVVLPPKAPGFRLELPSRAVSHFRDVAIRAGKLR